MHRYIQKVCQTFFCFCKFFFGQKQNKKKGDITTSSSSNRFVVFANKLLAVNVSETILP